MRPEYNVPPEIILARIFASRRPDSGVPPAGSPAVWAEPLCGAIIVALWSVSKPLAAQPQRNCRVGYAHEYYLH